MVRLDIVAAVFIIGLASLGIIDAVRLSGTIKAGSGIHEVMGPDVYLKIVCTVLLACALLLLMLSLTGRRRMDKQNVDPQAIGATHVGMVLAVYAMHTLAAPILGYFLSSVLFFSVAFCLFGVRPWLRGVLLGLGVAFASYVLFVPLLKVQLPKGWFRLPF